MNIELQDWAGSKKTDIVQNMDNTCPKRLKTPNIFEFLQVEFFIGFYFGLQIPKTKGLFEMCSLRMLCCSNVFFFSFFSSFLEIFAVLFSCFPAIFLWSRKFFIDCPIVVILPCVDLWPYDNSLCRHHSSNEIKVHETKKKVQASVKKWNALVIRFLLLFCLSAFPFELTKFCLLWKNIELHMNPFFFKMINEKTKLQSMENEKFFPPKKSG